MKNIALWIVLIATFITGWDYGIGIVAILSLLVGIEYEQFTYNELLHCKFQGIRSYKVADIYYYKKHTLWLLIYGIILVAVATTLAILYAAVLPEWIKYVAYPIIAMFVYGCTYTLPGYIAFSRYDDYLKKFLDKEQEEWNKEDIEFNKRLEDSKIN